ncbi:MAG: DUF1206 domain-containing protein [Rhodanobacteraceae bacterium]
MNNDTTTDASGGDRKLAGELAPWVIWLARIGFLARGLVYALIGLVTLGAAFGIASPPGSSDVFADLGAHAAGSVLLIALAAGLCCCVLWRVTQVLFGFDLDARSRWAQLALRFNCLCVAIFYAWLIFVVMRPVFGDRQGSNHGRNLGHWTQWVMGQPLGRVTITAIGIGILVFAAWQFYRAARVRVVKRLQPGVPMDGRSLAMWIVIVVGEFGVIARAVVFAIVGGLLVDAAWRYHAGSQGLPRALQAIRNQPFGHWLLAIIAAGLIAYGVFQFGKARWRGIGHPCDIR